MMSTHFTDLPNEIVLIIWIYLTHAETIRSFSLIKSQRYNQLLQSYCYKMIDFYTTTFSTFQLCCTRLLDQFRLNVQILKLGHRDYFSQIRLFSHYCLGHSSLRDIFPQMHTIVLRNVHESDANDLLPYLSMIPYLEQLTLHKCPLNKISLEIFEHLFKNSVKNKLKSCILNSNDCKYGLFLCQPLPSSYQSHHSLTYLQIYVRNLATLKYLLMFLPKLIILDVHISTNVTKNDRELFPMSFNPCCNLTKLVIRSRSMEVLDIDSVVKCILLFQSNLQILYLTLIHRDLNCEHSLTYIDGHYLYDNIVIRMKKMEDFSFCIETAYVCNQQMNNIIQSFQTEYWLRTHIGCHYDSTSKFYVIFTLPYVFDVPFVVTTEILCTKFNHSNDHLDCLMPMLFAKAPGLITLMWKNECAKKPFLNMLNSIIRRKKTISIRPNGAYQLEKTNQNMSQFDIVEVKRFDESQSAFGHVDATITWFSWMSQIRILNIDNELLFQLINRDFSIDQLLSIEILILRQTIHSLTNEPLTTLSRLGKSSSLHTINIQKYRMNNELTMNDLFLILSQMHHNLSGLKMMTIDFDKDAPFHLEMIKILTDTEMKNSRLRYFHATNCYIELWFNV